MAQASQAPMPSAPGKPTVLLVGDMRQANEYWTSLSTKYTLLTYDPPTTNTREARAEFFHQLSTNPAWQSIVGCYRSNHSTSVTGPFDAELVSHLPTGFKFVAHLGAGYDNIDVEACTARKIAVANTPGAVDDATADTGIFLMLGALRRAAPAIAAIKAGTWRGGKGVGAKDGAHPARLGGAAVKGHDPKGKVLGILGMGGIGRATACRAVGFGMEVVYHNRRRVNEGLESLGSTVGPDGKVKEHRARYVSFDELLATSDVLSLNLALNASTKGIISAAELAKLKKGAVVVNTARGGLISEDDLVDALESGHVSAIGLDVFENEPIVHHGLLENDRAFLLPHVGTMTWETELEMEMLTIRNLESAVDTGKFLTLVGEQKGLEWAEGTRED